MGNDSLACQSDIIGVPAILCFKKLKPSPLGGWSRLKAFRTLTIFCLIHDWTLECVKKIHIIPVPPALLCDPGYAIFNIQVWTLSGGTVGSSDARVKVGFSTLVQVVQTTVTTSGDRCHFWCSCGYFHPHCGDLHWGNSGEGMAVDIAAIPEHTLICSSPQ